MVAVVGLLTFGVSQDDHYPNHLGWAPVQGVPGFRGGLRSGCCLLLFDGDLEEPQIVLTFVSPDGHHPN